MSRTSMKNEMQRDYLDKYRGKGNEWICACEIVERLEISLEDLLNAYGDGLTVYDADLKSIIHPMSQLDDKILYSNDAALYGQIDFDRQNEMLVLLSPNLPDPFEFKLNEKTGAWRLKVDYDDLEFNHKSWKKGEYDYNISIKKLYNFSGYNRDEADLKIEIHAVFLEDACINMYHDNNIKFNHKIVLLKALYNEIMFYGVPIYFLNEAKRILNFNDYSTAKILAYASEFAYYYFYDIQKTIKGIEVLFDQFSINDYATKYNIPYNIARHEMLQRQKDLYVNVDELICFLKTVKERTLEEKLDTWNQATFSSNDISEKEFEKYKTFARMKFMGSTLKEIFDAVLPESKAVSAAAQDTACSKLGNKVKKFAINNNLPLWTENRGRPIAGGNNDRNLK